METVWLMQNHQFELSTGDSILLGEFKVTLLEIEGQDAVFEVEGPDGEVCYADDLFAALSEVQDELPVLI